MPADHVWYNYHSKVQETTVGQWVNRRLTDEQQALFVLGGTTLPILKHADCMALLECIENPITLEVYLDDSMSSYGQLYIDDGETLDYKKSDKSAIVEFSYSYNTLSSSFLSGEGYEMPAGQTVNKVIIYGIDTAPVFVMAGGFEAEFLYDVEQRAVITTEFSLALGSGKMIEIAWN